MAAKFVCLVEPTHTIFKPSSRPSSKSSDQSTGHQTIYIMASLLVVVKLKKVVESLADNIVQSQTCPTFQLVELCSQKSNLLDQLGIYKDEILGPYPFTEENTEPFSSMAAKNLAEWVCSRLVDREVEEKIIIEAARRRSLNLGSLGTAIEKSLKMKLSLKEKPMKSRQATKILTPILVSINAQRISSKQTIRMNLPLFLATCLLYQLSPNFSLER